MLIKTDYTRNLPKIENYGPNNYRDIPYVLIFDHNNQFIYHFDLHLNSYHDLVKFKLYKSGYLSSNYLINTAQSMNDALKSLNYPDNQVYLYCRTNEEGEEI